MSAVIRQRLALSAALTLLLAACAATPVPPPASPAMVEKVGSLAPHPCNQETAAGLEANGVTPDRLVGLYYLRQSSGGEASVLINHQGWAQVAGESSQTVVVHNNSCQLLQVYRR